MKVRGKFLKFILGHLLILVYFAGLVATSLLLFFQMILTLGRQKLGRISQKPYFKSRSIFPTDESVIISHSERKEGKSKKKVDFSKIDEGFGGAYERIAYTNILKDLANQYGAQKVLELNSTFIAGVPAFNSSILAQEEYDLTITVHSRDYEDAIHAWKIAKLADKVKIVKWDDDFKTPFKAREFDLVWNHLAIEHYSDSLPLISEMARVSKKLVVTMTLSPWNLGFVMHWAWHKLTGKKWDHGYIKNTLISTMERLHKEVGLKVLESGGCDDPVHLDTVDWQMGKSMTYFDSLPKFIRKRWVWTAINPACQNHFLVKFSWFLERNYPEWFRRLTAHHLYVASIKKK